MNLVFLDEHFIPVKTVDYINLQWNRRYYECGQFSIQMLAKDYDKSFWYAYRASQCELGIVQKTEYTTKENGEFIQISGFFLEYMLNNDILYPTFRFQGDLNDCIRSILTTYCSQIPQFKVGVIQLPNTTITIQQTGEEAGKQIYSMLQKYEYSYRLSYDYVSNTILFDTWQGIDRTTALAPILGNEPAVFSQAWGGLKNLSVVQDESNYKNYAVIAGSGEGEKRQHVILDNTRGEPARKVYIDARDLQQSDDMTQKEYWDTLAQRGAEKLNDYAKITNIAFEATGSLQYQKDFDLGDKCDLVISGTGMEYESRIIGVDEVIKENRTEINLLFGDKIPKRYRKV